VALNQQIIIKLQVEDQKGRNHSQDTGITRRIILNVGLSMWTMFSEYLV
jgi:hypothetical protein